MKGLNLHAPENPIHNARKLNSRSLRRLIVRREDCNSSSTELSHLVITISIMPLNENPYEPPRTSSGVESPKTSSRGHSLLWIALAAYVLCFALPFASEYYFNPGRFTDGMWWVQRLLRIFIGGPLILPVVASAFGRKNFLRLLPWSLILFALMYLFFGIINVLHHLGW